MKRNGFTLIEMMIVILIIAILATLGLPVIVQSIMRIEKEASLESAALSLRQFYIDARSKSLLNESVYELTLENEGKMTFSPKNLNDERDKIHFSPPSGIRSQITYKQRPDENATYSYILGMFAIYNPEKNNYQPQDSYSITILINGKSEATVTIEKGYPKFEKIQADD